VPPPLATTSKADAGAGAGAEAVLTAAGTIAVSGRSKPRPRNNCNGNGSEKKEVSLAADPGNKQHADPENKDVARVRSSGSKLEHRMSLPGSTDDSIAECDDPDHDDPDRDNDL